MNEELKARLTELGFTEEQIGKLAEQGVTSEEEMAMLGEQEVRDITGCNVITAKKVVKAFMPAPTEPDMTATSTAVQNVLPALPDDMSYLELLKTGGVLKIDRVNVISAMRAAIASDVGLYNLPDILIGRMEQFALEQEEPLGESFYKLQRQLTRRDYGEVLSAIGATGSFVSDRRKKETLARLDAMLWPALRGFNDQLQMWINTWTQGASTPALIAMAILPGAQGVMPPGMLQPPDSSALRDEGEAVINQINKVFAGTGIPVARALAFDAMQIRSVLEDPNLPSTVGAATRDQMLKTLGIDVGADYIRLERNASQFALAIMEFPKVAAGTDELSYLSAMWTLGSQIPWDRLGTRPSRKDPAYVVGDHDS